MPHDYILTSDGELYHYGVLGMKWGVRRYQDKNGRLTAAGKARVKNRSRSANDDEQMTRFKQTRIGDLLTHKNYLTGESYISALQSGDFLRQEVMNIGTDPDDYYGNVAEALAAAAAVGTDLYPSSDEDRMYHEKGMLSPGDLKRCNPGYDSGEAGTIDNCPKCAASLEMNMRGINVSAGRSLFGAANESMSHWFKGAEPKYHKYEDTEDALKAYGPNTSGTLAFCHMLANSGHEVHWTNDIYGNFEIQDGQNGRTFNSLESMMKEYRGDTFFGLRSYRLDNCEPNYENMARDGVLRVTEETLGYSPEEYDYYDKVKNPMTGHVKDGTTSWENKQKIEKVKARIRNLWP